MRLPDVMVDTAVNNGRLAYRVRNYPSRATGPDLLTVAWCRCPRWTPRPW